MQYLDLVPDELILYIANIDFFALHPLALLAKRYSVIIADNKSKLADAFTTPRIYDLSNSYNSQYEFTPSLCNSVRANIGMISELPNGIRHGCYIYQTLPLFINHWGTNSDLQMYVKISSHVFGVEHGLQQIGRVRFSYDECYDVEMFDIDNLLEWEIEIRNQSDSRITYTKEGRINVSYNSSSVTIYTPPVNISDFNDLTNPKKMASFAKNIVSTRYHDGYYQLGTSYITRDDYPSSLDYETLKNWITTIPKQRTFKRRD